MSTKAVLKSIPNTRSNNLKDALKEVELIRAGKLPEKSARDFLKESHNR
ncbi:hypothetical protein [Sporosarcina limicola]|uniref:Uncharacterized protein n=1 Tax=Sporosarcina limicola TaxID=34101 RepID=A0A927MQH3_9BACL|nr:hypothetical protein [Sporosarcina limicola]MBE1555639.1 hypothetical protein [Sporosarcina limicola]